MCPTSTASSACPTPRTGSITTRLSASTSCSSTFRPRPASQELTRDFRWAPGRPGRARDCRAAAGLGPGSHSPPAEVPGKRRPRRTWQPPPEVAAPPCRRRNSWPGRPRRKPPVAEYTAEAAKAGGPDDASLGMLWHKLSELPVVTIAKIRGRVRGAGSELALACDMRFAARENAILGQIEVGAGATPGAGGVQHVARLARRIASFPADAVRSAKQVLNEANPARRGHDPRRCPAAPPPGRLRG